MIESDDIYGVKTDTFHLRSSRNDGNSACHGKSLHMFFIAGNPGTLHFYTSFLERLLITVQNNKYFENYDTISCHGVGHANHHLDGSKTSELNGAYDDSQCYGLEFQISHKLAFIMSVLDSPECNLQVGKLKDGVEVMMIGHSIGAYMVIDILTRSEQLMQRTRDILLLMPFISWTRLPMLHRAKLSSFLSFHPMSHRLITSLAAPLLRMKPSVRENILRRVTSMKGETLDSVGRLINRRLLNNFLTMGVDEIRDVRVNQNRIFSLLEELDRGKSCNEKNILLLYTDNDVWSPLKDAEFLRNGMKNNTTVVVEPGLTHAFSLTDSRIDRTCDIISKHFDDKRNSSSPLMDFGSRNVRPALRSRL